MNKNRFSVTDLSGGLTLVAALVLTWWIVSHETCIGRQTPVPTRVDPVPQCSIYEDREMIDNTGELGLFGARNFWWCCDLPRGGRNCGKLP